jgi:broad specificity phosphatase PhoE
MSIGSSGRLPGSQGTVGSSTARDGARRGCADGAQRVSVDGLRGVSADGPQRFSVDGLRGVSVGDLPGVLLARHGQTDDNLEPVRAQGFSDTPLNAVGLQQARALAERIATAFEIASLWCSDLSRTRVTAEIVGARIGLEPRPDPRLREGNRGDWEGQLFIDVARAEPETYAAWMAARPEFRFPGGESLAEHADRVAAALVEIHAVGPLPALVVCHRGSIRTVLCHGDPRGLRAFHEYDVANTGVVPL